MSAADKLLLGAEYHWPGSGARFVAVWRAYAPDKRVSLWAAATIAQALKDPEHRAGCLRELRDRIPHSTRSGPKRDRETAAREAIESLIAEVSR